MIIKYFAIYVFTFNFFMVFGIYIVNPGPKYPPTKGEVWPKPQIQLKENTYYKFNPLHFQIKITDYSCETLSNAVKRYLHILKQSGLRSRSNTSRFSKKPKVAVNDLYKGLTSKLKLVLTAPCENYPSFDMDESYSLVVSKVSTLESGSVWGVIRGLETFAQLVYDDPDNNEIRINTTNIIDFPSYPHRGLLLDTSRHYITVGKILKTLDAMAMNKMNVFHWHIVDDHSFPYQSERFPELSHKGAFHSSLVYTKKDIEKIVQYARVRGIRVIPELDIPGHTRSWGAAYPNILTECYSPVGKKLGLGPMDPLSVEALDLLEELIVEVKARFPDKFFHVGGDEVDLDCWNSNPNLVEYMHKHLMTAQDLHSLFMKNAIPLLGNNTKVIVWQEVFDENVPLTKDTIVQVWKSLPTTEMIKVLKTGRRVLFSSDWYLSSLNRQWTHYYKSDPRQMVYKVTKNHDLLSNIVGGEACMWGEMVDDSNVISRVWPRASAIAETLWNSKPITWSDGAAIDSRQIPDEVYNRIEEHVCRMIRRGINAQPASGPGFCVV